MNEEIYKQNVLDHYKQPHHKGVLDPCDVKKRGVNPYCGDDLTLYLRVEDGAILEATFDGDGCAISVAGASMLTDKLVGMTLADAGAIREEDVYALFGTKIGPARAKCALLAYGTLREALHDIHTV